MGQMSLYERLLHPTTAEIMQWLDMNHCDSCEAWATGAQPWLFDPNSAQGKHQLDSIGEHMLTSYSTKHEDGSWRNKPIP